MRRIRSIPLLLATLVAITLTSCGEPAAPDAGPTGSSSSLLGSVIGTLTETTDPLLQSFELPPDPLSTPLRGLQQGVLACPSSQTYTASAVVGPNGGTIKVGPHTLYIPSKALTSDVRITAKAPAGSVTTVTFEPHGLRFERPTALTMSYAHCPVISSVLKRVVYVDANLRILEVLPSANDLLNKRVTGKLDHFSAYAFAE